MYLVTVIVTRPPTHSVVINGIYLFIFTAMSCNRWQNAKRYFINLGPKLHFMKSFPNGKCLGLQKPLVFGVSCSSVSVVLWGNIVQVCLNALWLWFLFLLHSCGIFFTLFNLGPVVSIFDFVLIFSSFEIFWCLQLGSTWLPDLRNDVILVPDKQGLS